MRRIVLSVAALGTMLVASGSSAWAGHGHGHCHSNYGAPRVAYAPYTAYRARPACAIPYAVSPYAINSYAVPYGYPSSGFSVAGRNFSVWFGR